MSQDRYEEGLKVRREVLGEQYVDAALARADDFTGPLQDLVTDACWGGIWTREGLTRQTRSLLNVVMMVALNRPHELRIHLRGAIRNGCTREEIREALLQTAAYAGFPAALDGFRVASEVLAEIDADDEAAASS